MPDAKIIRLYVDDEPFDLASARILRFERALDMRAGTLDRQVLWETPGGQQLLVESPRLVSFQEKHVAAISYQVTVLNVRAALVISSEIVEHLPTGEDVKDDPRLAQATAGSGALPAGNRRQGSPRDPWLPHDKQRHDDGLWDRPRSGYRLRGIGEG